MSHSPICDTEEARTVFSDGTLGSNGKVVKLKELLLQSPFSLTQSCDMTREKRLLFFSIVRLKTLVIKWANMFHGLALQMYGYSDELSA